MAYVTTQRLNELRTTSLYYLNQGVYSVGTADDYRLGALAVGYRGKYLGVNGEPIRHVFQNKLAHTEVKPQPWFKNLGGGLSLYSANVATNKYSLCAF